MTSAKRSLETGTAFSRAADNLAIRNECGLVQATAAGEVPARGMPDAGIWIDPG